jgi:hypothetical protein NreA
MPKLRHPARDAVTKRVRRAAGHLAATAVLLEKDRSSIQIAHQLAAVGAAIAVARQQLVQEQLQVCLDGGDVNGPTLRQLKMLARFL